MIEENEICATSYMFLHNKIGVGTLYFTNFYESSFLKRQIGIVLKNTETEFAVFEGGQKMKVNFKNKQDKIRFIKTNTWFNDFWVRIIAT